MNVKLKAPDAYYELTPTEKANICNGMGAKDSFLSKFIPNTIWGLDITEAANIHDYMYYIGTTELERQISDVWFRDNLHILINNHGGCLAWLRSLRASKYYRIVRQYGHNAFWKNKQISL